jgi:hypothetical protein
VPAAGRTVRAAACALAAVAVVAAGACSRPSAVPPAAPVTPDAPSTSELAAGAGAAGSLVIGDGFTVLLPGPPDVERVDVPVADGSTAEAVNYQARAGDVFVAFGYAEGAGAGGVAPADDAAALAGLRASAEAAARDAGGALAGLEELVVAAVRSRITTSGGVVDAVSFFDGGRLYTVQAAAAGAELDPAVLDEVVATISLG